VKPESVILAYGTRRLINGRARVRHNFPGNYADLSLLSVFTYFEQVRMCPVFVAVLNGLRSRSSYNGGKPLSHSPYFRVCP
jgi:hypothetical protein